jgi:DNA-binding NarL/FixJ family response regulator
LEEHSNTIEGVDMAKVQINSWEDGDVEGVFDTVEEAEAYVLEEEMDVVVYDFSGLNGKGYRFNTEIAAKREEGK